ncbi:MAG: sulfurtransferase, partial [Rhodoferax sp.]
MYTTLISVAQLQALQHSGQPFMVFDCSFDLVQPDAGEQQYRAAHIPGAVYAHLNKNLSAVHLEPAQSGGRHPLPLMEAF